MKRSIILFSTLALLLSCGTSVEPPVELLGSELAAWEEFRSSATRVVAGRTIYVVEWDRPIESELELRHYYDALQRKDALIVNLYDGVDDIWYADGTVSLSYCVSDTFDVNKSRAVVEMASATAAWASSINVSFSYVSSQDATCTGDNTNVTFAVMPWDEGGACAFVPSGDGCVPRTLVIDFDDVDTSYPKIAPNLTSVGVFRHELGHILGFRHEHARPDGPSRCREYDWRELTVYDQGSVMHYPWCDGVLTTDWSLTALDVAGATSLYGISVSLLSAVMPPLM